MVRVLALSLALLIAPASASAGGWAITTLSSTPTGQRWTVDIKVLQHGVTPMRNITPAVVVKLPRGGEQRFPGKATGAPGVYRASVVFPKDGTYRYHVDDGFTNALPHDSGTVRIGGGGGFPWWWLAFAVAATALLVLARARRGASSSAARRSAPEAAPGPTG